jgi:hypothetical protein
LDVCDLSFDLVTRGGLVVQKAHHAVIGVQRHEVVNVRGYDAPEYQPVCSEHLGHEWRLRRTTCPPRGMSGRHAATLAFRKSRTELPLHAYLGRDPTLRLEMNPTPIAMWQRQTRG